VKKFTYPFLIGLFFAPLFVFFHESGHYMAARAFGVPSRFHLGRTYYGDVTKGIPVWIIPCSLGLAGLFLTIAAVRLHRRGDRFFPFGCAFVGIAIAPFLFSLIFSWTGII
jgi:hypothetical protein